MFSSDEEFKDHVQVVFTFSDKNQIDDHEEWLTELCQRKVPVPTSIAHGMNSTRDGLMKELVDGRVTAINLRPSLDIKRILEENELSGSATNVAFLVE